MSFSFAIFFLAVMSSTQAYAGFQEGSNAYKRGDYLTAIAEWRPIAEKGDARAQTAIGIMYAEGKGVPVDYAQAVQWLQLAANQGSADAQGILGGMYEEGKGVRRDCSKAVKWYQLAADQGMIEAQVNLAYLFATGKCGIARDYVKAHMWYNLAARYGNQDAKRYRDIAAKRMQPSEVLKAERLAQEWLQKNGQPK